MSIFNAKENKHVLFLCLIFEELADPRVEKMGQLLYIAHKNNHTYESYLRCALTRYFALLCGPWFGS